MWRETFHRIPWPQAFLHKSSSEVLREQLVDRPTIKTTVARRYCLQRTTSELRGAFIWRAGATMIYQSLNLPVLRMVPTSSRRVLDIGCGGGMMGAWLKEHRGCEVTGITNSDAEAEAARRCLDRVIVADLNHLELDDRDRFDCVICSHVLEHLIEPQHLLRSLQSVLSPVGMLVVALPNVTFWRQRLLLLGGRFAYTDGGIMDRTHLRFFDWEGARALLESSGFDVERRFATGSVPGSRHFGPTLARRIDSVGLSRMPGLFGFQFVLRGQPTCGERNAI